MRVGTQSDLAARPPLILTRLCFGDTGAMTAIDTALALTENALNSSRTPARNRYHITILLRLFASGRR